MLRETKSKSKKFRVRWSKVPHIFEPPKIESWPFLSPGWPRPFQAEKHPKWQEIAISRGYVHFQQMLQKIKSKSKKFRIRWSKIPRVLEPLKSSYGHFSHPAGHGWGKFSSRKTPKMARKRNFPGLRAFSANVARDKIEERETQHPMVKSTARFGAPKIELCPF